MPSRLLVSVLLFVAFIGLGRAADTQFEGQVRDERRDGNASAHRLLGLLDLA